MDWDLLRAGRSDDGLPACCLWLQGFLTNCAALRASFDLPAEAPDAAIVEACVERYGGRAAAVRLGGSLSWVVWDRRRGLLTACRDRMGLQPLFYLHARERILLDPGASQLAAAAGLSREPDSLAVAAHLAGRVPPSDRCWLGGVSAVPPAHVLEIDCGGAALYRYWSADAGRPSLPASVAAAEVASLLSTVVAETMPAEGFALTLSSGLDSGSLALWWRRVHPQSELDAVLWSSPELPTAEEAPLARRVARELRLRAHFVRADLHWPLSAGGEPLGLADSPFVPFYAEVWEETFRRARLAGASGLATGAGGDHLFGYGGVGAYAYPDLLVTGRWGELVRQVRDHHRVSPASLLRILDLDLLRPLAHLHLPRRRGRPPVPWLGPRARRELRHLGPPRAAWRGGGLPSRRHRLAILSDPAVAKLLADFGVRARRHGLELRHPLLDHRLIELAARLPGEACFRAGTYKVVLRDVVRGHLPAEVVERRRKVTPEAIFDRGLRERQVAQVRSLLSGMRSAEDGWVDEPALGAAFDRYLASGQGGGRLWAALTLEHWLRRYF